ncbi:thrombospondin type-1 domain-containing protein 7A-like [Diadema antillarum]|uniref:thrombospondin type-1 domain-containing protein 7A-like n=1 Tax=Diadema antillarum TaxID=105358 RepID=UPI003A8C876B
MAMWACLVLCLLLPLVASQHNLGRSASTHYSWETGQWGACSGKLCGFGGIQRRPVWCESSDRNTASDSDCAEAATPPRQRPCFRVCSEHRTFFRWEVDDWGPCRQNNNPDVVNTGDVISCGPSSFGLQQRTVRCMEIKTSFVQREEDGSVPSYICQRFSAKPATVQECITPCAQDCIVTQFSPWSRCSRSCGNGTQTRTRRVVIPPSNGGGACPPLSETKPCVGEAPCVDEEFFTYSPRVSPWGACQLFPGSRQREHEPAMGKQSRRLWCQRSDGRTDKTSQCFQDSTYVQPATHQVCLVASDCQVSGWSEWSPCSDPCSSNPVSHSVRKRSVLSMPTGEGEKCPELVQRRACSYDGNQCPRGRYVWRTSAWSECDILPGSSGGDNLEDGDDNRERRSCGGGLATREVFCTHVNDTAFMPLPDELCDPSLWPGTTTHCHIPCPKSCQVGPWTGWGPCISRDCEVPGTKKAKGHISRTRRIVSASAHGGRACPHLSEHAPCNVHRCYRWVTEETTCQPNDAQTMCGDGMMTRRVSCINSQEVQIWDKEEMCESVSRRPEEEVACTAPCPNDCVLGEWSAWSECSMTCEGEGKGGVQTRRRAILVQPGEGGAQCPDDADLIESRNCNHHSCTLFAWMTTEWGECTLGLDAIDPPDTPDEDGSCGMGTQTRNVSCSRINPAKVAPDKRCYEPLRPPSSRPCKVPCILDCVLSEFGDWTPCPTTCPPDGSLATQERRRYVLQYPSNEGAACPSLLREERACSLPESCSTYTWVTGPWTEECRLTGISQYVSGIPEQCGDGLQTRVLECQRSDGQTVDTDLCLQYGAPMPPAVRTCREPCSDDCRLTEWSLWSNCHMHCTGTQTRRRRLHGLSRSRSKCRTASYPEQETRPCKCASYRLVQIGSWSDCLLGVPEYEQSNPLDAGMECGRGIKYRAVVCLDQEDRYVDVSNCGAESDFAAESCYVPCPMDCKLRAWAPWRPCSGDLQGGMGVTTRWQEVLDPANEKGRPCPENKNNWIDETKKCQSGGDRVDAYWQADNWQTCEISTVIRSGAGGDCGTGVERRVVNCVIPTEHGFRKMNTSQTDCHVGRKPLQVQACTHYCPGQCVVSSWSKWTTCPQDCPDNSFRTRNRMILRNPTTTADTGVDSPLACPQLMERELCIAGINCFTYTWNATAWSPCQLSPDKICGEGIQDRLLQCLRSDGRIVDVSKCEEFCTTPPLATTSSCEVPCPVDCQLTPWSQWSECSKTCGVDAVRTRTRQILQTANNRGRPCPRSLTQQRPCKAVACYAWAITQWSDCTPLIGDCGAGVRKRNVTCRQPNGVGVPDRNCIVTRSMEPYHNNTNITVRGTEALQRDHYCEVPCPGECHYTMWSRWSVCHRTCVQGRPIGSEGIEVKSRASLTTDQTCTGDEWETRPCSGELCYDFDWLISDWERGRREVWCQRSDGLNVTGACIEERPVSIAICNPPCHIKSSYCTEDNRCVCDDGYKAIYSMTSGQLEECLDKALLPTATGSSTLRPVPRLSGHPGRGLDDRNSGRGGDGRMGDGPGGTDDPLSGVLDNLNNLNDAIESLIPKESTGNEPRPPHTTAGSPKQPSFLASLPPWVYAIAAVVVLLIVIVAIVLCCAKCAPKKKEEEKKPEPDYSMYWDETVQKKYTGEIEL